MKNSGINTILSVLWSDLVISGAINISNAVDAIHRVERERRYHEIISKYKPQEVELFGDVLGMTYCALSRKPGQDFLGETYMEMGLGKKGTKQNFSPYGVNKLLVKQISQR